MAAAVSNAGGLGIITSITIYMAHPDDPIGENFQGIPFHAST
jgi:NAD(P)H-dependent flavin oxidoreductase YrpB (nitropropane dioxygenase family)